MAASGKTRSKVAGYHAHVTRHSRTANNGSKTIARQATPIFSSLPKTFSVWAEVTHCNSRLWVTANRKSVVTMASIMISDSWGRKAISKKARSAACRSGRAVPLETSPGWRGCSSDSRLAMIPRAYGESASTVHSTSDPGSSSQPQIRNASIDGPVRLRRKLSNIFQRSSVERSVGIFPLARCGMRRPSQGNNCQSPRIQRCMRCTRVR